MKSTLTFIVLLGAIVARKGLVNLLVVLGICVPVVAFGYWNYRREVRTGKVSR